MQVQTTEPRTVPATRFWVGTAIFVAVLMIAVVAVALSGSTPTLRAREFSPESGSTVSANPAIEVTFARPVDKGTVESAVTVSPVFSYTLSWEENSLRLRPLAPLRAETEYTVQVGPGIADANGTPMEGELRWSFMTRQPRIAFLKIIDERGSELWMSDADGGDARRLSAPGQTVQSYAVAPDGGALIFTVEEGAGSVNLWRVDEGARGLHRLTGDEKVMYGAPAFSPSGELVAVEVRTLTQVGEVEQQTPPLIELRNPNDGASAGRVYGGSGAMGHTPRWSPDGTRLAFFEANQRAVGVFDFTIGEPRFFPGEEAMLSVQTWSPDNRALVYTSVVVDPGGSAQQQIVYRDVDLGTPVFYGESVGDQADPAWHPQGELIAYAYKAPPGLENGNGIWTMLPTGEGKFPLVTAATIGASPEVIFSSPLWSPDGEWLVFTLFDPYSPDAGQSLWIVQRNGGNAQPVITGGYQPLWVP